MMHRRCSACGASMTYGYVIDDGLEYYCSDDCLYEAYLKDEFDELYRNDRAYWTEWEDEHWELKR